MPLAEPDVAAQVPLEPKQQLARTAQGVEGVSPMIVKIDVTTRSRSELQDITATVEQVVAGSGVRSGVCHLFLSHTTAGLTLNENWDPDVKADLLRAMAALVPDVSYHHNEGNSPAHLLSTLVGTGQTLLIDGGRLLLGTWQGIYLAEFDGPRNRRVLVKIVADPDAG